MPGALDLYRQQHRELLSAAAALGARLDHGTHTASGGHVESRAALARLAGKLLVHLQMEDAGLYPELQRSQDAEVRATALRFQAEMGTFRATAEPLLRRWLAPAAIEGAPDFFSADLRPLLHALAARIAAEDAELFPLADRPG